MLRSSSAAIGRLRRIRWADDGHGKALICVAMSASAGNLLARLGKDVKSTDRLSPKEGLLTRDYNPDDFMDRCMCARRGWEDARALICLCVLACVYVCMRF